ncbi:interferon gamma receptor 2 isoform X2 [Ornithorhynchus anatinus]|uniref:Interferon gamma receptor 2 n=1 Tax=Ornithorhynchus anatinus TaxID=9258 RepID=F7AI10_ORNAN|nr:interferon gamma receptor 2 isoform X2 [Ornithorhynchus anatinus]
MASSLPRKLGLNVGGQHSIKASRTLGSDGQEQQLSQRHEPLSQLPAPRNATLHLYNQEQVLRWQPVSLPDGLSDLPGAVTYSVEYRYTLGNWMGLSCANCTAMATTVCTVPPPCFMPNLNVTLRVRAQLGALSSPWLQLPSFKLYYNVTIGPPKNIQVTSEDGTLRLTFSPPFEDNSWRFQYYVHYWPKTGIKKTLGPVSNKWLLLEDVRPVTEYCLQVQASLQSPFRIGLLSNTTCLETTADAVTRAQYAFLIFLGALLAMVTLAFGCFLLVRYSRGLIKYWFQKPPTIPSQIGEYLEDPKLPMWEELMQNPAAAEGSWDSVSVLSWADDHQATGRAEQRPGSC